MYLVVGTRPDIACTVEMLAKFVDTLANKHWKAPQKVSRYLIHTRSFGLVFVGTHLATHITFFDADQAGDQTSRKSMTGCVVKMAGGAVSWPARQQKFVVLLSTEVEYISLCSSIKNIIWIRRFLKDSDMVTDSSMPTMVFVVNKDAVDLTPNQFIDHRSKTSIFAFILLRRHYVKIGSI